jgi:hypothetical protein
VGTGRGEDGSHRALTTNCQPPPTATRHQPSTASHLVNMATLGRTADSGLARGGAGLKTRCHRRKDLDPPGESAGSSAPTPANTAAHPSPLSPFLSPADQADDVHGLVPAALQTVGAHKVRVRGHRGRQAARVLQLVEQREHLRQRKETKRQEPLFIIEDELVEQREHLGRKTKQKDSDQCKKADTAWGT